MDVTIHGYENIPIPNTLHETHQNSGKIAIIFPGYEYGPTNPLLYYATEVLYQSGCDVLVLDYAYNKNAAYLRANEEDQAKWLKTDACAAYESVLREQQYRDIILVGKSLGTASMSNILCRNDVSPISKCVWLTPVIPLAHIKRLTEKCGGASLVCIGTADNAYIEKEYESQPCDANVEIAVFENADHSLEVAGNFNQSLAILKSVMVRMSSFVGTVSVLHE